MSKLKKKLTKNQELIISLFISMALCLLGYILLLETNAQPTEELDRISIIRNGFNNYKQVLPVLSDSMTPSLIVWSIIAVISNYGKSNQKDTSKIRPQFAITVFILYLLWYIVYLGLKAFFFEIVIVNIIVFVAVFIIALLFFNEYSIEEE